MEAETTTIRKASRVKHIARENKRNAIILFFIHPFSALILSIKNYRASYARDIVWFFVIFFGFTFVISNQGIDANRQRDLLQTLASSDINFQTILDLLYAESNGYVDLVKPLVMFIVSRFTDNYRVLFAVFGLIFGYFYSRNIWYLIDRAGPRIKRSSIPAIIIFALIIGFWNINGFRMWTAAQVFFFGAIQYLLDGRKKGIGIAATSILFHFSFMFPVGVLLLFFSIRNRVPLFFWFFIVSFFISELNLEVVRETLTNLLPPVFHPKIISYTHEGYAEASGEQFGEMRWYAKYYGRALSWAITGFLIIFYFKGISFLRKNKAFYALFGFSLLFMGMANVASNLPSGGRFVAVASLFAVALVFLYLQHLPPLKIVKYYKPIANLAFVYYGIFALRLGADVMGVLAILGNPIIALFGNVDIALIQLLK